MSLTPKDMDFIEAKHGLPPRRRGSPVIPAERVAREPGPRDRAGAGRAAVDAKHRSAMTLLGIPGDNTYSNYQEVTRSLWRQILPEARSRNALSLEVRSAIPKPRTLPLSLPPKMR